MCQLPILWYFSETIILQVVGLPDYFPARRVEATL